MQGGSRRFSYPRLRLSMNLIIVSLCVDSYCMYALVRLSQHVMSAQDTGSFLSMSFGKVLVQVKRNYDRYMQAQLRSVQEAKVNKKSKCGILPFVANFEVCPLLSFPTGWPNKGYSSKQLLMKFKSVVP